MPFYQTNTKLKRVKCSNTDCTHVFKVYDRCEPVVNDPGFVIKQCPKCHNLTRFFVWNVDYFEKAPNVVGVYELNNLEKNTELETVPIGECVEEAFESTHQKNTLLDFSPKISFVSLVGKNKSCSYNENNVKKLLEEKLYWAKQAYLGSKLFMADVNCLFVKILNRKNATRDYCLLAKRLHTEDSFNLKDLSLIELGKVELPIQIDGLYSRDECFSILDFCLRRWAIIADKVIVSVPFIGFQYKNKRCKNQVLSFWAYLNEVLDMEKTVLLTRKKEFNRVKEYLNEMAETFEYKKYWGKLDQLLMAADEAGTRKKSKEKKKAKQEAAIGQVFFTDSFHSKFYAGIINNRVEVLIGSYNVHMGDILENLAFREYSLEEFKIRYLDKMLLGKNLHIEKQYCRVLSYTVNGSMVDQKINCLSEMIK